MNIGRNSLLCKKDALLLKGFTIGLLYSANSPVHSNGIIINMKYKFSIIVAFPGSKAPAIIMNPISCFLLKLWDHYLVPQRWCCWQYSFSFAALKLKLELLQPSYVLGPFTYLKFLRQCLAVSLNCPDWTWACDPSASTFQIAGIANMYHQAWLLTVK